MRRFGGLRVRLYLDGGIVDLGFLLIVRVVLRIRRWFDFKPVFDRLEVFGGRVLETYTISVLEPEDEVKLGTWSSMLRMKQQTYGTRYHLRDSFSQFEIGAL